MINIRTIYLAIVIFSAMCCFTAAAPAPDLLNDAQLKHHVVSRDVLNSMENLIHSEMVDPNRPLTSIRQPNYAGVIGATSTLSHGHGVVVEIAQKAEPGKPTDPRRVIDFTLALIEKWEDDFRLILADFHKEKKERFVEIESKINVNDDRLSDLLRVTEAVSEAHETAEQQPTKATVRDRYKLTYAANVAERVFYATYEATKSRMGQGWAIV